MTKSGDSSSIEERRGNLELPLEWRHPRQIQTRTIFVLATVKKKKKKKKKERKEEKRVIKKMVQTYGTSLLFGNTLIKMSPKYYEVFSSFVCFYHSKVKSAGTVEYTNSISVERYDPPHQQISWIWH